MNSMSKNMAEQNCVSRCIAIEKRLRLRATQRVPIWKGRSGGGNLYPLVIFVPGDYHRDHEVDAGAIRH